MKVTKRSGQKEVFNRYQTFRAGCGVSCGRVLGQYAENGHINIIPYTIPKLKRSINDVFISGEALWKPVDKYAQNNLQDLPLR